MSSISIIGVGNMAGALAGRALAGGNTVEIIGRDPAKARALAAARDGATVGVSPSGDLVIVAVPYASAVVVSQYGDALKGKAIVDITNPLTPDVTGFLTPAGSSGAQEIAEAAPAGTHVVKAFNTVPCDVLVASSVDGRPVEVFIAGDDAQAKSLVSEFIESGNAPDGRRGAADGPGAGERHPAAAGPHHQFGQEHQPLPWRQHSQLSAPTLKRTVKCAFSSLAEPATPVRTSSPS